MHAKAAGHLRHIRKSEPGLRREDDLPHLLDDTLCDRFDIGLRELGDLLIPIAPAGHAASPGVWSQREPAARAASLERRDSADSTSRTEPGNLTPRTLAS